MIPPVRHIEKKRFSLEQEHGAEEGFNQWFNRGTANSNQPAPPKQNTITPALSHPRMSMANILILAREDRQRKQRTANKAYNKAPTPIVEPVHDGDQYAFFFMDQSSYRPVEHTDTKV